MTNKFVHLECQSEYSIVNSTIRIQALIARAKSLKMHAVAIVDNNNLFAAIKFYKAAVAAKIKPIFGAKITIDNNYQITLLCINNNGYKNLSKLISLSYTKENNAFVTFDELKKLNADLIIINHLESKIGQLLLNNKITETITEIKKLQQLFDNRNYLGVKRILNNDEEKYLHLAIKLATKYHVPVIATNAVQFLEKNDFYAHEARVCIATNQLIDNDKRLRLYTNEQYLKSNDEMLKLFSDTPAVITNTIEIAKRCNVNFELNKHNYLPAFDIPNNLTTNDFFIKEATTKLNRIIAKYNLVKKKYQNRLNYEIKIILKMGFTGYFLIVADFIAWAKKNNIPVGPGRGSGSGSLVAYSLGISSVDPIKYDLLFERFLNPERVSMPDFDIDFCTKGRDKVIEYVINKYGKDKVSQIVTFGTMAAKGVIRDVGRILGQPYGFSDKLSKLIPMEPDITIDKALNYEKYLTLKIKNKPDITLKEKNYDKYLTQLEQYNNELKKIKTNKQKEIQDSNELQKRYASEEAVSLLINLAKSLEGLPRNIGTHAGGVVIAPNKISDFCPTYNAGEEFDATVSQFDKDDIEAIGLVKFDFLGLSNLSVIAKTVNNITKYNGEKIIIEDIDLTDKAVYKLYQNADTTGVFQLESSGMREYLRQMKPTNFNDIVAMLALYRPGAMDYIDDYIAVKHGKKISFPHLILEKILTPTNGVFVYQEQVMRAAQEMAGFSLGNADLLRRAMGKKKADEMAKQRKNFVVGAEKNNINNEKANEVFDYIDKFAGYGFNKSHSVAYALISYQTAWLKTHYYSIFMASVLSNVMGDSDRLAIIITEVKLSKIKIMPPNINYCVYDFVATDDKTINYGLGALKGVGQIFIEQIVINKITNYQDLFDFCLRIDRKYLNKQAIESLIFAGAMDCFKQNKATLIASYEKAVKQADIKQKDKNIGQTNLFAKNTQLMQLHYNINREYDFRQQLELGYKVMGFYFYQHPVDEYKNDLTKIAATFPSQTIIRAGKNIKIIALIEQIFYRKTKNGQMANVMLSDAYKKINAVIFNDDITKLSANLITGKVVVADITIMPQYNHSYSPRIIINNIDNIETIKAKYAKYIVIKLTSKQQNLFIKLKQLLLANTGHCPVVLQYQLNNCFNSVTLNTQYNINATQDAKRSINNLLTYQACIIYYH